MLQKINWFTKSRRAQNINDDETWNEGGVSSTLNSFDNGGESRATVLIIEDDRRTGPRLSEEIMPTLQGFMGTGGGNVPMVFPIDDAREIEKFQNKTGIGDAGAPAYTLDTRQASAVVAVAYDEYNDSISDTHHTLRSGTKQSTGVIAASTVRRLTPTECERLQGFPDGWTADQADSNRYKQMGNAVAVPVVSWIIGRMV
jgi:site-specific DNA-cytosine methylase